ITGRLAGPPNLHFYVAHPFAERLKTPLAGGAARLLRGVGGTYPAPACPWGKRERGNSLGWAGGGRMRQKDLDPCLPYVDLLFMNEDEARMATGTGQPAEAARTLRAYGAGGVIVKLGEKGCSVFAEDEPIHAPAIRVPAVDTTGAGDCFAGGFLAALHRGASWSAAARFANAVAALSIQKLGAVTGLLSFEATERWMK
ncbi:MAG: carbohydrate kinase family protein, partial [Bryobacteraceae bacterium]